MIELTPRQQKCMIFLKTYMVTHGISPSYEEIAGALGLKAKSNALYVVDALEGFGLLKRIPQRNRSIELLHSKYHHAPDCMCDGCAHVRYLASLKFVHALKVDPPISVERLKGLHAFTLAERATWFARKCRPQPSEVAL